MEGSDEEGEGGEEVRWVILRKFERVDFAQNLFPFVASNNWNNSFRTLNELAGVHTTKPRARSRQCLDKNVKLTFPL